MSLGLYVAAILAKDLATLESVFADETMIEKAAVKFGVTIDHAREYLRREIEAKRNGF